MRLPIIFCTLLVTLGASANINQVIFDYRQGKFSKSTDDLKLLQSTNNPVALYENGIAHLYGYAVPRDVKRGIELLEKSGTDGYLPAQQLLAKYYLLQKDDPKTAFEWFKKAADQDDVDAQLFVVGAYKYGFGVKAHPDKARKYFIKAAKAKNPIGEYLLAMHFFDSRNKKNHTLGELWLNRAADQGHLRSQFELARRYLQGDQVDKDTSKGNEWLAKAREAGYQPAIDFDDTSLESDHSKAQTSKNKKWVSYTPDEARAKTIDLIMDGKVSTTKFANYHLPGIFTDWKNEQTQEDKRYNQSPKMHGIQKNAIFDYEFTMVQPNSVPLTTILEQFGVQYYEDKDPILQIPTYPMVDVNDDPKLLERIKKRAAMGVPQAQFQLGQFYQYGHGVNRDMQQALKYYQLAADQLYMKAEYNIGVMYLIGNGVDLNYDKALQWLEKTAYKGNAFAQYTLGLIYEYGLIDEETNQEVKQDLEYAHSLYSLATINNHGMAMVNLADLNLSGLLPESLTHEAKVKRHKESWQLYRNASKQGLENAKVQFAYYQAQSNDEESQKQAYEVIKDIADEGDPYAALLLGILYERGIGTSKNPQDAIKWYQLASEAQLPIADFMIGTHAFTGNIIEQDGPKALLHLKRAAEMELPFAYYNLAVILHHENPHSEYLPLLRKAVDLGYIEAELLLADYLLVHKADQDNLKEAAKIYTSLADQGYPRAQLKVGYMYQKGIYFQQSTANAMSWYEKAAKQGNPIAEFLLGNIYQYGFASAADVSQAKYWYERSSKKGNALAMNALGFLYDTVDHDYSQAAKWYEQAVEAGNPIAKYNLGLMYEYGKGREVDFDQAYELFVSAADAGFYPAKYSLATKYLHGYGVSKDFSKAFELFKVLANQDDGFAYQQLGFMYENGLGIEKDPKKAIENYQRAAEQGNQQALFDVQRLQKNELKDSSDKTT